MRISFSPPNKVLAAELETERFILRPLGLWELMRDPYGWRSNPTIYGSLYQSRKPMTLRHWLKRGPMPDQQRRFTYGIIPKGTDKVIGMHMVRFTTRGNAGNTVGIHDPEWLGRNVVAEVRARLMSHFFEHTRIDRFTASIVASNHSSIFTYRKLGYTHAGTWHRDRRHPETGEPIDVIMFEMLKEDWMRSPHATQAVRS